LRRSILACGLVLAFAGLTTAAAAAVGSGATEATAGGTNPATSTTTTTTTTVSTTVSSRPGGRTIAYWSRHIRSFRAGTQRWLTVMRGRPPAHDSRALTSRSLEGLERLARSWRHREHRAWWRANHPPELHGWICIHQYEGSWTDSGGPYWGGLQMDYSFQATYGSWLLRHKGTADHWSPLEQIWVAVRAWRVRGFSPWPSTARYCGMAS
jgi:hypothetical protein